MTPRLARRLKLARGIAEDAIYLGGFVAITFGAAELAPAAGWIVGGVCACAFAWALGQG